MTISLPLLALVGDHRRAGLRENGDIWNGVVWGLAVSCHTGSAQVLEKRLFKSRFLSLHCFCPKLSPVNYILKGAAHICPVVFLFEVFHPSRFPSSPFFFYQLFRVSASFPDFLTAAAHTGWLGLPAVCFVPSVSLGAARCCALPADPGLVSKNPTGCWLEAAHSSVCSVGLGLRAAKDRFVGGGCWLSPGCPGASV